MVRLTYQEFIKQLDILYQQNNSVHVTYKHIDGEYNVKKKSECLKMMPESGGRKTSMVLIRATDGKKKKVSTIIKNSDVFEFQIQLSSLMRKHIKALLSD